MATVKDLARPESIVDRPLNPRNRMTSRESFTVVPSDTANFARIAREIQCGGAGTVAVVKVDDTVQSFTVVAGESIHQLCKRINSTGTTATLMVGIV